MPDRRRPRPTLTRPAGRPPGARPPRRPRALLLLPATAGVLLLSGCGDPTAQPGSGGGATTVAPTSSPGFSVPPTVSPSKPGLPPGGRAPTGIPKGSGRPVTLEGVVESGVEPGCKVLAVDGGTSYLLLSGGEEVPLGVPVRVEGVLLPGVLSTCQQGTPLRVTKVQRR